MKESPLFLKSFEMLTWLLQHTRKFPKHQRFVMAKRMEEAGLAFHDEILWAVKSPEGREAALGRADFHLERLKVYNRLVVKLELESFAQYEHLARTLDEMGRLLGGWQKSVCGQRPVSSNVYARRPAAASPARPRPRSSAVPGSGTT